MYRKILFLTLLLSADGVFAAPARPTGGEARRLLREELKEEVRAEIENELKQRYEKQLEELELKLRNRPTEKYPFEDLPQNGVLASVGGGVGSFDLDGFGGVDLGDDSRAPPFTAALSKNQQGGWVLKVSNSSESSVTMNLEVQQFDKAGRKLKRSPVSVMLAPQGSSERRVSSSAGATQAKVVLLGWKAKSRK